MKKLRIYLATQTGCKPCEDTKETLNIVNSRGTLAGVDIHEVGLSGTSERAAKMGVTKTPTLFIVEVEDLDGDGILEESEEKHLWHQFGSILDSGNLEAIVENLKQGNTVNTAL